MATSSLGRHADVVATRGAGNYIAAAHYRPTAKTAVPVRLPPPQLLEIAGPDAAAFAHAQFSSDVKALSPAHWQWSAWLSAQGRVRALFRLLRFGDDRFLALLSGGSADALRTGLAPFVLRAKVVMRAIERRAIGGFDGADAAATIGAVPAGTALLERDGSVAFAVDGTPRWCMLGAGEAIAIDDAASARWRAGDVAAGIVELDESQSERFLPDALGLGRLGAVSVRKGCYPGQEIVARLHFKGGNKRWLHRVDYVSAAPPARGIALATPDGAAIGELLNSAETAAGHGVALATLPELPPGTILAAAALPGSQFRVISAIGIANA